MIDAGVETWLTCVDLKQVPRALAGRRFDHTLLAELPASADPCGENGEFHTCVVAGPMFSRRIAVSIGAITERDGYAYADVAPSGEAGRSLPAQHSARPL
jgi:diphthamide synthase (EF-2-diphthine--ammonia ligase)